MTEMTPTPSGLGTIRLVLIASLSRFVASVLALAAIVALGVFCAALFLGVSVVLTLLPPSSPGNNDHSGNEEEVTEMGIEYLMAGAWIEDVVALEVERERSAEESGDGKEGASQIRLAHCEVSNSDVEGSVLSAFPVEVELNAGPSTIDRNQIASSASEACIQVGGAGELKAKQRWRCERIGANQCQWVSPSGIGLPEQQEIYPGTICEGGIGMVGCDEDLDILSESDFVEYEDDL
ncbi:hypothetical protein FA13DRAFT_1716698 [Coprinellus micaceus]|uniref:Uncharacterized protein n=1 Tax=Coprinellus micaceus TaxID=71717 RepID=A0A4Y7SIV1_COPMI|nr:hypothetical protein FA13DRAFT_1716698 [Coprinellus micaceus]